MDKVTQAQEWQIRPGPSPTASSAPHFAASIEDDPNLTDKKFPGNPTRSYRSKHPLLVVCEVLDWEGHSPEELKNMRDHLDKLKRLGIEAIND